MLYHYTPEQVRMLVRRAERQLEQAKHRLAGGNPAARST